MTITRPTSRRSFLAAGTSAAIMAARASSATPPARVMVVGGTGRLGSIVVRRLLAGGIPVAFTTRSVDRVGMFGPGAQGVVADLNQRAGRKR